MKTFAVMLFVNAESLDEAKEKALLGEGQLDPVPSYQWPLILQPLKLLQQPGDKGAGDIIERTIGPLGGDAFKSWYETTFGRPCGCSTRKEHWNQRYPLKP